MVPIDKNYGVFTNSGNITDAQNEMKIYVCKVCSECFKTFWEIIHNHTFVERLAIKPILKK